MGKDGKIAGYVSKVKNLVHLMKDYGETLTYKMTIDKLMRTLTSHFDHVIVAIQEFNNVETMKLEDLVGSLEVYEIRIVERKTFKIRYKHYRIRLGRSTTVPTNSKSKETRLRARSFGQTLKNTRSVIGLLNPRKEDEETHIRKTKRKKVCSAIIVKNGVTWPRIIGIIKTRDRQKARRKEKTLHARIQMIIKIWWLWMQL